MNERAKLDTTDRSRTMGFAIRRLHLGVPGLAIVMTALLAVGAIPALAAGAPSLATDKPDYSPGQVVHISGTGFAAGNYDIPVKRPDGSIVLVDPVTHTATPGWGTATAGADGSLAYDYQLDGIAGSYEARAYPSPWNGDWTAAPVASVTFTDLVSDFKQCANKDSPLPAGTCHWIGSIVQGSNANYTEGMALPQRVVFDGIVATSGDNHVLTFDHDNTKGGIHAFDYLVSYAQATLLASNYGFPYSSSLFDQACADEIGPPGTLQATCNAIRTGANHAVVNVPDDPFISKDGSTQSRINAFEGVWGDRTIDIYGNAPITNATLALSHDVSNGGDTGDSTMQYVLTWTSSSTSILITYATHIAIGGDPSVNPQAWGINLGASAISGGPYHNNLDNLDGATLGSQDNQLKGADLVKLPPTVVTTSSPTGGSVVPGTTASDTATVNGSSGPGTGTIDFYLCGPGLTTAANATTGCPSGGTHIGSAVTLSGGSATSAATSSAQTLGIGLYCWRAEYTPGAHSPYLATSHTNGTTECFTTVKQPSSTDTTADPTGGSIVPGTSASDSATVSGGLGQPTPTGTVKFFLCQPGTVTANGGDCSAGGDQIGTPAAGETLNGSGVATSEASTNTLSPGTYCWRAEYSGDDFYLTSSHTNSTTECFTVIHTLHPGTIGFWRNWRNHYTSGQFQLLIDYLKTNNAAIYNKDLVNATADDLTIAKIDAIYYFGNKTPRQQMVMAQFTALKLNLAITQLDGTGGLVQLNDDICLAGTINVSGIPGAGVMFEGAGSDNILTIQQVVTFIESKWTGNLTTNRNDWTFNFTKSQWDTVIQVITGMNEGTLIVTAGC